MDQEKRQRLEEKGWKVGSAVDFLGLTKEDVTYIELRSRFVAAIKERRKAKLSQLEFARVIGSSQSRVAKMEANDPSVSLDLIVKSLVSLGVTLPELGKILVEKKPGVDIQPHGSVVKAKRQPRVNRMALRRSKSTRALTVMRGDLRAAKVGVAKAAKKR